MRITNKMITSRYTRTLNDLSSEVDRLNTQVASGRAFEKSSENTSAAIKAYKIRTSLDKIDGYQSNIDTAGDYLKNAETSLTQIEDILKESKAKILQGQNGTESPNERRIIATELRSLQEEMFQTLNTNISGSYIFGGSNTDIRPFEIVNSRLQYNGANLDDLADGSIAQQSLSNDTRYVDIGLNIKFNADTALLSETTVPYAPGSATPSTGTLTFSGASQDAKNIVVNGFTFNFAASVSDKDIAGSTYDVALGATKEDAALNFETAFNAAKEAGAPELKNISLLNDKNGTITFSDSSGNNATAVATTADPSSVAPPSATFSGGLPAVETKATFSFNLSKNYNPGDTIKIGNDTYQFVKENPTGNQVAIGSTVAETATNLSSTISGAYTAVSDGTKISLTQTTASNSSAPAIKTSDLDLNESTAFSYSFSGVNIAGNGTTTLDGITGKVSNNIYDLLGQIATAFESPDYSFDKVDALYGHFEKCSGNTSRSVTEVGAKGSYLEFMTQRYETQSDNLTKRQTAVEGVDPAKVYIQYKAQKVAYEAALQMGASVIQKSIFDFLS